MLLIGREGALAPDPGALRPWFLTAPWLVKPGRTRTQLAEGSRAEASWVGVYARASTNAAVCASACKALALPQKAVHRAGPYQSAKAPRARGTYVFGQLSPPAHSSAPPRRPAARPAASLGGRQKKEIIRRAARDAAAALHKGRRAPTSRNKNHHVRVIGSPPLPDAQAPRSRFLWGDFCWIRRQHGIASRHEVREARPAVSPVKARV